MSEDKIVKPEEALWPLLFATSMHAVHWADCYLSRPKLPCQIGQIIREAIEHPGASIDTHGERVTGERLRDLAETISVCLSGVDKPAGIVYRHIYGRHRCSTQIAEQLARIVWDGPDDDGRMTLARTQALAILMIEDVRLRAKGRFLSAEEISAAMHMGRTSYYKYWADTAHRMRLHLRLWVDRAGRQMDELLTERGIL